MTTTLTQTEAPAFAGFSDSAFTAHGGDEPALLKTRREEAFARYAALPAPTYQDEEYRRTNPIRLRMDKCQPLAPLGATGAYTAHAWDSDFDVVVSVDESGYHIEDLSGVLGRNEITVCTLSEAATERPEKVEPYLYWDAEVGRDRIFRHLADAFYNIGLFIDIPAKAQLEKGILVRYNVESANQTLIPRMLVHAGTQSQATIVEAFMSSDVAAHCIQHREFYAEAAADLKVITVGAWGDDAVHIGEDWARVLRDGKVDLINLTLGGKTSKLMAACDVAEENASAYMGGLYFAHAKQHIDQKTLQIHSSPNTYSNMLYKGAAKDKAHSVYQGFIWAEKGAVGVDSYQTNNNLLLSQGARTDSIPGLIINADDLACSHGATIGNLEPEHLFYLQSRGIGELQARKMLVLGFFEEVVRRVPYAPIQDFLHEAIEEKLGS